MERCYCRVITVSAHCATFRRGGRLSREPRLKFSGAREKQLSGGSPLPPSACVARSFSSFAAVPAVPALFRAPRLIRLPGLCFLFFFFFGALLSTLQPFPHGEALCSSPGFRQSRQNDVSSFPSRSSRGGSSSGHSSRPRCGISRSGAARQCGEGRREAVSSRLDTFALSLLCAAIVGPALSRLAEDKSCSARLRKSAAR